MSPDVTNTVEHCLEADRPLRGNISRCPRKRVNSVSGGRMVLVGIDRVKAHQGASTSAIVSPRLLYCSCMTILNMNLPTVGETAPLIVSQYVYFVERGGLHDGGHFSLVDVLACLVLGTMSTMHTTPGSGQRKSRWNYRWPTKGMRG